MESERLADILHDCGLDALSHPPSKSMWEWDNFRLRLAWRLLNRCAIEESTAQQGDMAAGDTDNKGSFEERVQGALLFVENTPNRKIAEFIVHQNDAVDGLRENLEAFTQEFRKMYSQQIKK